MVITTYKISMLEYNDREYNISISLYVLSWKFLHSSITITALNFINIIIVSWSFMDF